jgi:hypothetical protein
MRKELKYFIFLAGDREEREKACDSEGSLCQGNRESNAVPRSFWWEPDGMPGKYWPEVSISRRPAFRSASVFREFSLGSTARDQIAACRKKQAYWFI